jgi:AmmeMemoRadiSam system protein B/AmmeMemoRadiSam system protein A
MKAAAIGGIAVVLVVGGFWIAAGQTAAKAGGRSSEAPGPGAAPPKVVRPSALAGSWYEGTREALEKQVKGLLAAAKAPPAGARRVGGLVAPHAGYRYAGRSQGACYKVVEGARYDRVILLGPTHRYDLRGISVAPVTHYATPLGEVPVDLAVVEELKALPAFQGNLPAAAHAQEHSIEIQLPFLQAAIGSFRLVPILVGQIGSRDRSAIAAALRPFLDDRTLVVASSDFTHYGARFDFEPFPPGERKKRLEELDLGAALLAEKGDADGFSRYVDETGATICGARPIAILLAMLPPGFAGERLSYTTSEEVAPDPSGSVSYVSLAFRFEAVKEEGGGLSREELERLVAIARFSLEAGVRKGKAPPDAELRSKFNLTPKLEGPRGVFVTLKSRGGLRGCIGMIFPEVPLYQATARMAVASALEDTRFRPVTAGELEGITVEVSALTVPRPVKGPEAIRVGTDGVVLRKGGASAVFLPQVATEQGWDRDTMLSHLAMKAGLPQDAWRNGATFLTFQAEIAHETKASPR